MRPNVATEPSTGRPRVALHLALPIAILVAVASLAGIAWSPLYAAENAFVRPQLVAQDTFNLLVALPLLLWARARHGHPSFRRRFVELGTFGYLAYSYGIYAFNVRHNALFLVYVALFSLATYGLVAGTLALPRRGLAEAFAGAPAKLVGWFMVVVGVLFAAVWLADILTSLAVGRAPLIVTRYEIPTFSVYVFDLGFALPALLWGGYYTTKRDASGIALGGIMLVLMTLMMTQLAFGNLWLGLTTGTIDWPFFSLFAVLATAGMAFLWTCARQVAPSSWLAGNTS